MRLAGWFAACAALAAQAQAAPKAAPKPAPKAPPVEARVVQVPDASTLVVQAADGSRQTLRLAGVEPLEPCQPGAGEARQALAEWTQGHSVTFKAEGRDRGGRVLAHVQLEGDDLSRRLVEEGWAFSARTKWDHGPYVKQERQAVALHRGIYALGGAVQTPERFRREHGPCAAGTAHP
mgnify:CR=1 FL=1